MADSLFFGLVSPRSDRSASCSSHCSLGTRRKKSRTGCPAFLSKFIVIGVVLLKFESRKTKKGFWISEDLDEKVDIYLRLDNCASRSEFVENALRFYIGYLNTKNAGSFLPEALSAMLTGTLDNFAGRMGSLLFKQGVDLNVLGQIIAYDTDIDEGEYQRLRGRAIRDMKRTNGRISFKDALDFQKSV